jgi:hypothetical protein
MLCELAEMALSVSRNACKLLGDATEVADTADAGTRHGRSVSEHYAGGS